MILTKVMSLVVVASALPFRAATVPFGATADHWSVILNPLAGSLAGARMAAGWAVRLTSGTFYRIIAVLLIAHGANSAGRPLLDGALLVAAGIAAGFGIQVARIGMETGPLAVWLWNELTTRGLPIVCLDARHANAALSMMPNKTDRHDAAGLAQIVRQAGTSKSMLRATAPISCGPSYRRATFWSASEVRSRTKSAGFSKPSVSCLEGRWAALPAAPRRSSGAN